MSAIPLFTYHIWCRTEELGPDRHLVTVLAIPVPHIEGGEATSESRLFVSPELAVREGERMTAAMARRLASAGHRVVQVTMSKSGRA